ncbi:alkylation response protein AidB-like acyl-CoA dehydrogenase/rubredoxin [Clostridium tetanomorphum]|uniref:Acyl-CoA dehydrogenase n=2 Tax=Clostridium TaxID=1485 RepID=A0A923J2K9_CLOTT|nr:acyl-CoA dehydrogenase family protein [Clostridium tetanomorphum]KAJ49997.1 acyl-CoA dehydrogenase domain-containing protein [Clostridium tetanomorphum DSM 665]MBC2398830.1 acyl-CoA dehydrogenase [Clostridium tetanomorphum]MBP1863507.1 alkylation response protein AidB-like acyl-CoA dehydrogenase/rubredoxin [Clostridium tetanomorphum]NRS83605.1 alkylation response protein AidB-like acyl-CoA dehydrogenase/rubredoxin [Clostridium tetanomorphum]NRZ96802.1 alkylation response protein AidB-like a
MFYKTTEQHENLRAKIRELAEEEVKPIAFMLDQENKFPWEAVHKLADMGMMGIPYAKEYGGAGLDVISYAIAVEELSRVDGGTGVILSAHTSLGAYPIAAYGTEEQKQKYLVPLSKGEKLGAFGLTEENAGSDAGGTETTAVLEEDHYILNGEKIFITNAGEADIYIIFAVTTPDIGTRGISAFIVEKGWEGFSFGKHYDKMGIRSSATGELIFNNVKVPKENLLGKEGEGFKIAMSTLDGGRIGIASQALGIAQGAYENALEYSKERIQFGRPICQQQIIAFKLADMATKLRAARLLVYSAAELKENHERYSMEAAMAKQYASDVCLEIVNDALQIFGGSGYMKGMEVERAYRDAKICTIYEGTNEIQRLVISSSIIGKMPKNNAIGRSSKREPATGYRKKVIFNEGTAEERVNALVKALKEDGYDFTVGIPLDTPITKAERVVSVGLGIGEKENMKLIEDLAVQAGAAIGSSRPVAETLRYVPLNRYVGMSGQKFKGNLYVACGISGAGQHLKGIKDASTIVAINIDPNAKIFKNADYGIVGDLMEILPILTAALDNGEAKKEAPPMKKMKRAVPKKVAPTWKYHVCNGCGYEYDPGVGDPEGEIMPGTLFKDLPEEWTCPACGEEKDMFIEV